MPNGDSERGAGLISMTMGLLFFFSFLVFSVNIMYNLYTTSVISSLAIDAAHDVAIRDGLTPGQAESEFREIVGEDVDVQITRLANSVVVDVSFQTRALLPAITDAAAFGVLDRTFEVKIEEQQG